MLVPTSGVAVYLYTVAKDQYASHVGFSVRREEVGSAMELLGGISALSGSSSTDTDILYEFIRSRQMVRLVDDRLDLQSIYTVNGDPYFSLGTDARIEALVEYWQRVVSVYYDNSSGLIEVRALAFDPKDAHAITQVVFDESSRMINELSAIAREDTTRYARKELDQAIDRLKTTRSKLTKFQNRTRIVDPTADLQGQMGLLNSLQQQLATGKIELEQLLGSTTVTDPRVKALRKKIAAIEKLIDQERSSFSSSETGSDAFSQLFAQFQELQVNLEFAEKSYLSAQAAYDVAQAEAVRKSRYLATYIKPTLAETAEYPRRLEFVLLTLGALVLSWSILVMIYYSLRDRR
ncbi:sugar transporter [Roseovarius bejariae]|uniref:sugar transporter n=1 Tax=Roseovarius bejariae TaxID=2576383 RepID=UPI0031B59D3E